MFKSYESVHLFRRYNFSNVFVIFMPIAQKYGILKNPWPWLKPGLAEFQKHFFVTP